MRSLWPTGGLWRHGDFLKLWSAETISQFGSQVGGLALPARRDPRARRERLRGRSAQDGRVPAVHPVHAARRRLGRSSAAAADPDRGRLWRAALLLTIPMAYVADALTLGQLFVGRLLRRGSSRSSSTSPTSRTSRRSSSATRSSKATRSSRSAARPPRSAAPASEACSCRSSPPPTQFSSMHSASSRPASSSSESARRSRPERSRRSTVASRASGRS